MHDWVKLTTRMGVDVPSPSPQDMATALQELFSTPLDNEHPDCWLECGSNDGPHYILNIFQAGHATFSKYSDADMSEELLSKTVEARDANSAFQLWQALIDGRLDEI